jgi:hypothetical protein
MGLQQWIVDGHPPAPGVMIVPGGAISDLFGRVPVTRFRLLAFGAGSVVAVAAPAPAIPIAAWVFQACAWCLARWR